MVMMEEKLICVRNIFNLYYLAHIKNISERYEIREMCNNFYNKLNHIYNGSKNNNGNHLLHKSSSLKGEDIKSFNKKNRSLPAIRRKSK